MPERDPSRAPDPVEVGERVLAHLDLVLRQMPAGVLVAAAPGGRPYLCNPQMEAIWRQAPPAGEDLGAYAAWKGFHADGRLYRVEEWPFARALLHGEVVEEEEIEIERGDGSFGAVRVSAAPVRDEAGEIVAAVSTFHDVTERKREAAVRRFLGVAGELLSSSLDFQTTISNLARLAVPTLADWCGVDVLREGRIERLAMEHVDPRRREAAWEIVRRFPPDLAAAGGVARVLRTGQPELFPQVDDALLREMARDAEHLRRLRELGLRSAMIVPLVARGRTLGAILFLSAESGRRYDERDLALVEELAGRAALAIDNARLYRASQAATRAKEDFLAVVSHELRTPLTAVIGYSELLELGVPEPVTEPQREHVQRIGVAARHLLTLIEDILTVVSLESGRIQARPQEVELGDVLRDALVIMEPQARERGVGLRLQRGAAHGRVQTDAGKLLQIVLNLLSNAIKFSPAGEVELAGEIRDGRCEIRVRDTGKGIRPDHLEQIFEPFWQAEEPITRSAGGTGLGLTLTRRLVHLLGGEIQVESRPGEGSVFTVRLPLRQAPA